MLHGELGVPRPLCPENRKRIKKATLMAWRKLQATWAPPPPVLVLPWGFDWQLQQCNCLLPVPVGFIPWLPVYNLWQNQLCSVHPATWHHRHTSSPHRVSTSFKLSPRPLQQVKVAQDTRSSCLTESGVHVKTPRMYLIYIFFHSLFNSWEQRNCI